MNKLILMCGVIGSGKTTWIQNYLKNNTETLVISKDDIRRMLHGGKHVFDPDLEPAIEWIVGYTKQELSGWDIIIDECNLTRKDRDWSTWNDELIIIYFPPKDKKFHVNRRMKDSYGISREVWEKVYDEMMEKFEEPTEDECDKLIRIDL